MRLAGAGLCAALCAALWPTLGAGQAPGTAPTVLAAWPAGAALHACADLHDPLARRRLQPQPCALPLVALPLPQAAETGERPPWPAYPSAPPSAMEGHAMFWRFPVQGHSPLEVPRHSWR
jgi:hypothetical protein